MYNDRIRQHMDTSGRDSIISPRSRINRATNNLRSDIPEWELQNREDNVRRRSCDGTLREDTVTCNVPETRQGERNGQGCARGCADGVCGGWGLVNHPLAMVYSPCQAWRDAYAPDAALERGTMFAELDLPFEATNRSGRGCF